MPRILVVEDSPDNMSFLSEVLTSMKLEVLTAVNGEQAIEVAQNEKPDLILMDLSLPRMDGWTAAGMIKSQDDLQHIPIIALTAHAMTGDRERALQAGCNDYLSKPLNLKDLVRKLSTYGIGPNP